MKRLKNKVHELKFHSIQGIIEAAKEGELPDKMMIDIHPHRWFNFGPGWMKELAWQNVKNAAKYFLVKRRG